MTSAVPFEYLADPPVRTVTVSGELAGDLRPAGLIASAALALTPARFAGNRRRMI